MKQRKQRRAQPGRGSYLGRVVLLNEDGFFTPQKLEKMRQDIARGYYNRRDMRAKQ